MNSICYVVPYFGTLPKTSFRLWLKSCKANPTVNWIILQMIKLNMIILTMSKYTTQLLMKSEKDFNHFMISPLFLTEAGSFVITR